MTLEWLIRTENLAISGPSGTGKTHLAEALAHKAIDTGHKVAWFTLEAFYRLVDAAYERRSVIVTSNSHPR